jgi:hypothetical protein
VHIDGEFGIVRDITRESGSERVDTLSRMNLRVVDYFFESAESLDSTDAAHAFAATAFGQS